ncbi:MAG: hypothetical protein Q9212_003496 [Teloschistes hypoglaucus]
MANPNFPRITEDLLNRGTLPDGHPLRTIFSQPGIQDMLFGFHSPGTLDRNDYDSMQVLVGRVMSRQAQARIIPLWCQVPSRNHRPCNRESTDNIKVKRCQGRLVDQANNFPGNAVLAYHPGHWPWMSRQMALDFKTWTPPATRVPHRMPKLMMCALHLVEKWGEGQRRRLADCPYKAPYPDRRRWARLCKQHCMQLRNLHPGRWSQRLYVTETLDCKCRSATGILWSCTECAEYTDRAMEDRAQHWRNELLHTYVRQKRVNKRKPYVDMTKPARAEPVCPWKNCGARPWIARRGMDADGFIEDIGEAEKIGLSLCLGCSLVLLI